MHPRLMCCVFVGLEDARRIADEVEVVQVLNECGFIHLQNRGHPLQLASVCWASIPDLRVDELSRHQ